MDFPACIFLFAYASDTAYNADMVHRDRISRAALVHELRLARDVSGLTQAQLSERSGIVQSTLSRIERGEMEPTDRYLRQIAQALGLEPEALRDRAARRIAEGGAELYAADLDPVRRLGNLADIADRLWMYEQRISALEKRLAAAAPTP